MGRKISELVIKNYYRENYIFPKMKFEFVNLNYLTDKYTRKIEKVFETTFYIWKKCLFVLFQMKEDFGYYDAEEMSNLATKNFSDGQIVTLYHTGYIVYWVWYSVFKKEGVKVKGYYTAKKWILGAV